MISVLIISVLIFIVLMIALIWVIHESKKNEKQLTDYLALLLMGIIWIPIGIMLKNYALLTTGVIFAIIGIANKKEWSKEVHEWKHLDKKEKKVMGKLLIILLVILLVAVTSYFLLKGVLF